MPKPFTFGWPSMAMQATMLAIESQQVIALRLTKMALGGPDTQREAELMVTEKLDTMAQSSQMMMMAALGGKHDMGADRVMRLYRSKVRANRRRLSGK
jgi:hypothetical protein